MMSPSIFDDPITLEVVWGRLESIAAEMQTVLRRTALSTLISAANDLGCEIMDARGWSVAHAATSNPTFNLTLPRVAGELLKRFPAETLREGDVLFTNDPWIGAGHLPDVSVVTPFFKHGKLAGFAGSIAHVSDIGGLLNQSAARSVYEEGVHFPPLKLYAGGTPNEAIFTTLRGSVRAPEMVLGDLAAIVTATGVAARHAVDLLDEYGLDDLQELSDAVQTRAERAMRETIASLPDGDYPYEHTFHGPDGPMTIGAVVRIRGDELEVDYVDVPPQHPHGGINSTMSFTVARTTYALNCVLTPHIPSNQGLFRPITVHAPEGSVLNPEYPASVNDRTKVGWQTVPIVQGALAGIAPHTTAPSGFQSGMRFIGTDPQGVPLSTIFMHGGGMGAGEDTDGVDAICYPTSSTTIPVEVFESTIGAHVESNELLPESAGTGRMRGGYGLQTVVRAPRDEAAQFTMAASVNQLEFPPDGLDDGNPGTPTRILLDGEPVAPLEIPHRVGALALRRQTGAVTLRTPGGGGFGDPRQRDPMLVLRDVRDELLTAEAAERLYGVRVDLPTLHAARISDPAN
ncbi:hydantoinase B/oxoprolinase family protein [Amycolatopsis jejuensis]|uniref:hydantoinase B/oxoprolinase family protein n=1 Tax=Amycolatopsis jejuensis TaxID=330084 RepID=UPI0005248EDE|nr:hydantoinase B/oxoprolinase family protein [Amycolatopsis jejuensis]